MGSEEELIMSKIIIFILTHFDVLNILDQTKKIINNN